MVDNKVVVLFPGTNYNTGCPLLYYAGFKFEVQGYEKISISYGDLLKTDKPFNECVEDIKNTVLKRLQETNFSKYSDIVFVSKSLGTVIAGWVEEKLCVKVRHIYLTPIKETLAYIENGENIISVVAGTKDKFLDAEILREHCIRRNVYLKQINGAGHRLEIWRDMDKNIEILREVVAIY